METIYNWPDDWVYASAKMNGRQLIGLSELFLGGLRISGHVPYLDCKGKGAREFCRRASKEIWNWLGEPNGEVIFIDGNRRAAFGLVQLFRADVRDRLSGRDLFQKSLVDLNQSSDRLLAMKAKCEVSDRRFLIYTFVGAVQIIEQPHCFLLIDALEFFGQRSRSNRTPHTFLHV